MAEPTVSEAEINAIKVQALHEAADAWDPYGPPKERHVVSNWLRDRAWRIHKETAMGCGCEVCSWAPPRS